MKKNAIHACIAALLAVLVVAAPSAQAKGLTPKKVKEDSTFSYYMVKTANGEEVGWQVENKTSKRIHVNRILVRYQCDQREPVLKKHVIYERLGPDKVDKSGKLKRGKTGLSFPCGVGGKVTGATVEGVVFNEVGIPHGSNKVRCGDGSQRSFIFDDLSGTDKYFKILVPGVPGKNEIKIILRKDDTKDMVATLTEAICGSAPSPAAYNKLKSGLRRLFRHLAAEHKKACEKNPGGPDCEKAKRYKSYAACMCVRG